ncbi:MAG: metallophosphoesterase [Oscillospiraceae bacterium]|jgi:hypothetical protein|nr:metallophosphoesterase [Oscillospiraceae bacterium]
MKKRCIKALCICLALMVLLATTAFAGSAAEDQKLRFGADGKFTILQIADTQDILFPRPAMVTFIERALDTVQPDLVIFTGDNSEDVSFVTGTANITLEWILRPTAERGIPFTFVFGNHDAFLPAGKDWLFGIYQSYPNCLASDPAPETYGTGNHNLPIYASTGDDVTFNLWMLDSNAYAFDVQSILGAWNGLGAAGDFDLSNLAVTVLNMFDVPYDYVHEVQLAWFTKTNDALTARVGHKVPSLVFQHIIVPEVTELLLPATEEDTRINTYYGKDYALALDPAKATGVLGEFPSPPTHNGGEFDVLKASGSVLGIVTGHDHVNNFIGTVDGIDLIQTGGISLTSYGSDDVRGVRVITLDETNPEAYETYNILYTDVFGESEEDAAYYAYSKNPASAFATLIAWVAKLFGFNPFEVMDTLARRFMAL